MNLHDPPNCVTKTVEFSAAVVDYVDSDDGENKVFPLLGGLSRDNHYAWISRGPAFEVVSASTGEKIAAWTFGGILKDTNTKVTCAVELPTLEDGYGMSVSSLYAVGLDCHSSPGMVCLFDIRGSKVIKAIQVPGKVTSLAVVDPGIIPEATTPLAPPLRLARGILAVGLSPGGQVLLLDLCLSEEDGAAAEGTSSGEEDYLYGTTRPHSEHSDELNPSCVVIHAPGDPGTEGPVAPGVHLAILLNEQSFVNNYFMLKLSENPSCMYRLPPSRVDITASLYVPQLASLFIGFSFGCFQVWDLGNLSLVHTSSLLAEPRNITFFAFQEPADDPRKYCYIWAVYGKRWDKFGSEGNSSCEDDDDLAFACMHDMYYQSKEWIDAYGWIYQDFVSIHRRFELELSLGTATSRSISRCISCSSLDGNLGRGRAPYLARLESGEFEEASSSESDLSLCWWVWQSWEVADSGAPCNLRHYITLFDLNQWYREQMPPNANPLVVFTSGTDGEYVCVRSHPGSPHLVTYMLPLVTERAMSEEGVPLLFARISPTSVLRFSPAAIPIPEEHLFPSALSFESSFLLGAQCIIKMSTPGLQRSLLAKLQSLGSKTYLYPNDLFLECLSAGLKPLYVDIHNPANTPVTEQRKFLLSLALEHHMLSYLIKCAMDTADGCAGSLGVTLSFLMTWVKDRSSVIKECLNQLSVPLFDCGGTLLPDPQATRLMSLCGRQLNHLSTLLKEMLKRCMSWILMEEVQEMKKWCDVLGILALHTEVVQWFCHVGLLPELADEDFAAAEMQASAIRAPRIPYPAVTLAEIYDERRKELEGLPGVVQVSDVLFIDGAVKEFGERLTRGTWKRRGSDLPGCYPPPTLQALLLTYILDGPPVEDKHCLVIYLFMDLAALLANERCASSISQLIKFPSAFSVSPSIIKLTQAFWLLDHQDFENAINMFLEPLICPQDIKLWQHRCVVRAFLCQGEPQKALKYVRVRQPPLGGIEDLKLNLTLLLENGLVHEAFNYQRKHRNDQNSKELLQHFYHGCGDLKELRWVLQNSLTVAEEEGLMSFLTSQKDAKAHELCVMYYLQRSRFIEALRINHNENPVKKRELKKGKSENMKTVRDAIVSGYASAMPPVARHLAAYCARHAGTLHLWKEVPRPVPMSVVINHVQEDQFIPPQTKSTLIGTMLEKARETWNPPAPTFSPPAPPLPLAHSKRKREEDDNTMSLLPSKKLFLSPPMRSSVETIPFVCTPVAPSQQHRNRNCDGPPLVFPSQISSNFEGTPVKPQALDNQIMESSTKENNNTSECTSALSLLLTPVVPKKSRKSHAVKSDDECCSTGTEGSTPPRQSMLPRTPQSILKVRKTERVIFDSPSYLDDKDSEDNEVHSEDFVEQGLGRLIRFQLPTGCTPSPGSSNISEEQRPKGAMNATPTQPLSRSPIKNHSQNSSEIPPLKNSLLPGEDFSVTKAVTEVISESSVETETGETGSPSRMCRLLKKTVGDDSGEFYSFEEWKESIVGEHVKQGTRILTDSYVRLFGSPCDEHQKTSPLMDHNEVDDESVEDEVEEDTEREPLANKITLEVDPSSKGGYEGEYGACNVADCSLEEEVNEEAMEVAEGDKEDKVETSVEEITKDDDGLEVVAKSEDVSEAFKGEEVIPLQKSGEVNNQPLSTHGSWKKRVLVRESGGDVMYSQCEEKDNFEEGDVRDDVVVISSSEDDGESETKEKDEGSQDVVPNVVDEENCDEERREDWSSRKSRESPWMAPWGGEEEEGDLLWADDLEGSGEGRDPRAPLEVCEKAGGESSKSLIKKWEEENGFKRTDGEPAGVFSVDSEDEQEVNDDEEEYEVDDDDEEEDEEVDEEEDEEDEEVNDDDEEEEVDDEEVDDDEDDDEDDEEYWLGSEERSIECVRKINEEEEVVHVGGGIVVDEDMGMPSENLERNAEVWSGNTIEVKGDVYGSNGALKEETEIIEEAVKVGEGNEDLNGIECVREGSEGGMGEIEGGMGESEGGVGEIEGGMGEIEGGMGESEGGMGEIEGGMGESEGGMGESEGGMGESEGGMGESEGGMGESEGGMGEIGGVGEIEGGVGEIEGGMGESEGGMGEIEGGVGEIEGGVGEIEGGMGESEGGMGEIEGGMGEIEGGVGEIEGGVGEIEGGMGESEGGMGEIEGGMGEIEGGVGEIEGGMGEIEGGLGEIEGGVGEIEGGMGESEGGMGEIEGGMGEIKGGMGEIKGGVGEIEGGMGEIEGGVGEIEVGVGEREGEVGEIEGGMGEIKGGMGESESEVGEIEGGMGEIKGGMGEIEVGVGESEGGVGEIEGGMGEREGGVGEIEGGVGEIEGGVGEIEGGVGEIEGGMGESEGGMGEIEGGMGEIEVGVGEIEGGVGEIEGGMGESEGGVGEIEGGMGEIEGGVGEIKGGMGESESEVGEIEGGMGEIEGGMGEIEGGMGVSEGGNGEVLRGEMPEENVGMVATVEEGIEGNITDQHNTLMDTEMVNLDEEKADTCQVSLESNAVAESKESGAVASFRPAQGISTDKSKENFEMILFLESDDENPNAKDSEMSITQSEQVLHEDRSEAMEEERKKHFPHDQSLENQAENVSHRGVAVELGKTTEGGDSSHALASGELNEGNVGMHGEPTRTRDVKGGQSDEELNLASHIEEYATSRRLTRYQMSLLSRSLGEGLGSPSMPSSAKKKEKAPNRSSIPDQSGTPSARMRHLEPLTEDLTDALSIQKSAGMCVQSEVKSVLMEGPEGCSYGTGKVPCEGQASPGVWCSNLEQRFMRLKQESVNASGRMKRHSGAKSPHSTNASNVSSKVGSPSDSKAQDNEEQRKAIAMKASDEGHFSSGNTAEEEEEGMVGSSPVVSVASPAVRKLRRRSSVRSLSPRSSASTEIRVSPVLRKYSEETALRSEESNEKTRELSPSSCSVASTEESSVVVKGKDDVGKDSASRRTMKPAEELEAIGEMASTSPSAMSTADSNVSGGRGRRCSVEPGKSEGMAKRMVSPTPSIASTAGSDRSGRVTRRSLRLSVERESDSSPKAPRSGRVKRGGGSPGKRRSARLRSLSPSSVLPVGGSSGRCSPDSDASDYASSVASSKSRQSVIQEEGDVEELVLRSGKKRNRPPPVTPTKSGPTKRSNRRRINAAMRFLEMPKEEEEDLDTAFVFSPPTVVDSEALGLDLEVPQFSLSPPKMVPCPTTVVTGQRRSAAARRSVTSLGPIPEDKETPLPSRRGRPSLRGLNTSELGQRSSPRKSVSKRNSVTGEPPKVTDPSSHFSVRKQTRRSSPSSLQPIEEERGGRRQHFEKASSPTSSVVSEGALDGAKDVDSPSKRAKDDSDALPRQRRGPSRRSLQPRKVIVPYKPRKSAKL